jgi:transposase-like protein
MSDRIKKGTRAGHGHRVYRLAFKQQVVQETLEPGASVSVAEIFKRVVASSLKSYAAIRSWL